MKVKKDKKEVDKDRKVKISNNMKFTILAIVLIILFAIAITPVTLQNDTFYTIKIGEHISRYGIDMQDPFSWHEDLAYTYPHWGYDYLIYLVFSWFGMTGIYISTCILSAILGISIYLVNTKLSKNQIFSFFITIGAMYIIRGYIAARAQLITFILFILAIYFIGKFIETRKLRYAGGLIVIPALIANLHLAVFPFYFILFLPYIGEYLIAVFSEIATNRKLKIKLLKAKIGRIEKQENSNEKNKEKINKLKEELILLEEKIDRIKIKRSKELQDPYKIKIKKKDNVKWLIVVMIISILAGFLTPLGTTPYTYLVRTMQGSTTKNINEHLPMTIINHTDIICVLIVFLALLMFTKVKIRLSDLFMLGGLFGLMLYSRRQLSMFTIICSITLNRLFMNLCNIYDEKMPKKLLKAFTSKMGMLILILLISALSYYVAKDKFDDEYIDKNAYPVEASNFILENIDLGLARFYNEYNYGSYMLYRNIPVFIDSRADLYAPEFSGKENDIFMDFIEISSISKFYEDIFEKYEITHVITYANSKMNMIIEKTEDETSYKQLYKDNRFVIYERLKSN